MGNLLLNRPEVFINVVHLSATVLPFLLAVGTIIALGLKREAAAAPFVVWGVFLLLFPFAMQVGDGGFAAFWRSVAIAIDRADHRAAIAGESRRALGVEGIQRRLDAGSMSADEVDQAVGVLIDHMTTAKPGGWNQPTPWQDPFLKAAIAKKLVSDDALVRLSDAFYGTQPKVQPLASMYRGAGGFRVNVDYGNPWAANSGVGVALLWDVTQVSIDGVPVKLSQVQRFGQGWGAYCAVDPAAGDHEVQIDVVCAYADYSTIMGGDPAQVPVSRWPAARKKWTVRLTTPLKVIAPGN